MSAAGVVQRTRQRLVPGLRNANWTYRTILDRHVTPSTRWLDLGCGHQLLPTWMHDGLEQARLLSDRCRVLVGIDYTAASVVAHQTLRHRLVGDIQRLPFADASFDLISANMVVEHVDDPAALLAQIRRVLAPGGAFLFHTPNRLFYQILLTMWVPPAVRKKAASLIEGREEADVFPTRYRMNSTRAIGALARQHGFAVEELHFLNSGITAGGIPPIALAEVVLARVLESPRLAGGRSNLIAVLRKPAAAAAAGDR
jgi:SAM-dependent methyltransferase